MSSRSMARPDAVQVQAPSVTVAASDSPPTTATRYQYRLLRYRRRHRLWQFARSRSARSLVRRLLSFSFFISMNSEFYFFYLFLSSRSFFPLFAFKMVSRDRSMYFDSFLVAAYALPRGMVLSTAGPQPSVARLRWSTRFFIPEHPMVNYPIVARTLLRSLYSTLRPYTPLCASILHFCASILHFALLCPTVYYTANPLLRDPYRRLSDC
mmetsp:Transcript_11981/g.19360  ORF Transcript_11981/g.19360 Transcript_11981/m.19360 type:complete len:210 (+) Transcript_11981:3872-4501(+)